VRGKGSGMKRDGNGKEEEGKKEEKEGKRKVRKVKGEEEEAPKTAENRDFFYQILKFRGSFARPRPDLGQI